ncbi:hypothetical protein [Mycoplana rhizolycopersici]|uniref:Uncharacterized protein n=1 Tax=Mycoplana rhizolycopersici TaxID=2746702 RepID=A0ABX2Q9N6_9HYPH|nr:hypothetical protein [Rhizobium rhizolycopersici]NVP54440.1 hypothetical protein [Rhizobium rhizolycopersici]
MPITFNMLSEGGSWMIESSGTFIVPGDALGFQIPLDDLSFSLRFMPGGGQPRIVVGSADEKSVTLNLISFEASGETAFMTSVGTYKNSELRLSLVVGNVGSGGRSSKLKTVSYSFFRRIA